IRQAEGCGRERLADRDDRAGEDGRAATAAALGLGERAVALGHELGAALGLARRVLLAAGREVVDRDRRRGFGLLAAGRRRRRRIGDRHRLGGGLGRRLGGRRGDLAGERGLRLGDGVGLVGGGRLFFGRRGSN